MEMLLFEEVEELVRSMAPDGLDAMHTRSHRRGIKVWFGPNTPAKEHYEAQFVPRRHVDDPDLAFEIASRLVDYLVVLEPIRQAT